MEKRRGAEAGSSTVVVRPEHPDMAVQFKIMDVFDAFEFEETFAVFEQRSQSHFSSCSYEKKEKKLHVFYVSLQFGTYVTTTRQLRHDP